MVNSQPVVAAAPIFRSGTSFRSGIVRPQMMMVLVLIGLLAAFLWMRASNLETQARQDDVQRTMSTFMSNLAPMSKLDPLYTDADGDLLADAPENAELAVKPSELTFAFIASRDSTNNEEVWKPVLDAISENTGLPCNYLRLTSTKDQLQAIRSGRLHVTAFSSGEVPSAVNLCGFIPVCTIGSSDDSFGYKMQFVASAKSDLKDLADLRGKKIVFTRPRSNSGYKAALVELKSGQKLLPERDYQWIFSYGHVDSINAVASGQADAAPVASDVFAREVAKGELKSEDFRVIYESERFPPMAFGHSYNLTSELREKIRSALVELDWEGTTLEKEFSGDGSSKFVALTYKDDWANIRRIDRAAMDIKREIQGN